MGCEGGQETAILNNLRVSRVGSLEQRYRHTWMFAHLYLCSLYFPRPPKPTPHLFRTRAALKAKGNFSSLHFFLNDRTKEIAFRFQHVFREHVSASPNGRGSHLALI